MLSPGGNLSRLLLHLVEVVGKHLERDRAIRNGSEDVSREGAVVGDAGFPHQRRIRRETFYVGLPIQLEHAFQFSAVAKDLDPHQIHWVHDFSKSANRSTGASAKAANVQKRKAFAGIWRLKSAVSCTAIAASPTAAPARIQ